MEHFSMKDICNELRQAQLFLSEVCLHKSAVWAGELLEDILDHQGTDSGRETVFSEVSSAVFEPDASFCYGRDLFEEMDYDRAAEALKRSSCANASFLRFYSQYMSVQKQSAEKCLDPKKFQTSRIVENGILEKEVRDALQQDSDNGLLHYLLGMILIDQRQMTDARNSLIQSVQLFHCHWGAWEALAEVITFVGGSVNAHLPSMGRWILPFVRATGFDGMNRSADALNEIQEIEKHFPNSRFVTELKGSVLHKLKNVAEARKCFEAVRTRDPLRLNAVHLFSAALLSADSPTEDLCRLATAAAQTDIYRPETCCAIGNYYAHIKENSKAIEYFERALRMDKNFSTAWTLLGHRHYDAGDFKKATNAYNRAVELNPNDYRVWYGLGQIQERQGFLPVALQHYKKAIGLKNDDDRMWLGLGVLCANHQIDHVKTAIKCLLKSVELGDTYGRATEHLAEAYDKDKQYDKAQECYERVVQRLSCDPSVDQHTYVRSLTYLASHAVKSRNYDRAEGFLSMIESLGDEPSIFVTDLRKEILEATATPPPAGEEDQIMDE